MAINSDIRDQAYQFFIEEAPELLQVIEAGLLNLRQEHSTAKVHDLMRAAHSIKGGAASVGLDAIATLAHRLENIFKALYSETLDIDTDTESQLLSAYDCLRLPLMEQISTGSFNAEYALALGDPIFAQLEERLGDALIVCESYIPSSAELGIDMAKSIFEVDVGQGLEHLAQVVAHPHDYEIVGELRAQAEVFAGFAELLNQPEFGAIAQTTMQALEVHPERALLIAQLALTDFQLARQAVLKGHGQFVASSDSSGISPSAALLALAESLATPVTNTAELGEDDGVDQQETEEIKADHNGVEPVLEYSEASVAEKEDSVPLIEDIFGSALAILETDINEPTLAIEVLNNTQTAAENQTQEIFSLSSEYVVDSLAVESLDQSSTRQPTNLPPSTSEEVSPTTHLSVRVDSERLGRMNNLVGELAINRNGLSLQNEQLQRSVRELLNRFARVQNLVGDLQELSDQMLVAPERYNEGIVPRSVQELGELASTRADFDSLELDNYGVLNSRLQGLLEDMVQLEESVDDIVLFARATDQTLEQQRQMLTQLRDELIWARMLPLGEVLNRFPRVLRDLSTTYHKPVNLKLSGTSVLVDKAVLEKLYDPLLHLLRNAFDHGIEDLTQRHQRGKSEQGEIEIRAYHQGSQTIIEVRDDGQGLNLERIGRLAVELGYLSGEQLAMTSHYRLLELIFEPGFSTASQVSELSGRGMGLDVVRSQMRSLKGTITVTSSPGVGTTFTLRLPLTLTIAKLLVCFIGSTALAMPSDSVEEIVVPKTDQVKESGCQRFLQWRGQVVPVYRLADFLDYACQLPETSPSKALISVPSPADWALPMLVLTQNQHILALEIDRLVTEQELVIKPFGHAIAPPSCTYGCTILGDGSLIPVIDTAALLDQLLGQSIAAATPPNLLPGGSIPQENSSMSLATAAIPTRSAPKVLVVDDAVALRRTLAVTLERAGCQVLQARDGREAIEQLQRISSVNLVICDIEMPNMNGFEFLSYRRQDPQLSLIPVAMLTSRSNDKHRWLAMQLGATAYFTKPYLEQDFLREIRQIIGQSLPESLVNSY